ncbi:MAG: bifunctional pyr operon transcriptional regulator/uracil phosphoribosyltransferase PyrR [Deltaproteobacteria bacterium]|nr:bifunctional pyr operon transcriptional regulator/uracil phosphoribosyltransferase PyrR [Deltaproteobacteria bacterium]
MRETNRRRVLDARHVRRTIRRMASQIAEGCADASQLALVAIGGGGIPLAARLAGEVRAILDDEVPVGILDVTLYRDDLSYHSKPVLTETRLDFGVDKKTIVLVDDVLFTGRTIRAALDALMEYGRPDIVRAATLVDRGHRELPVRADYVGVWLDTVHDDAVEVNLGETDGDEDAVYVVSSGGGDAG